MTRRIYGEVNRSEAFLTMHFDHVHGEVSSSPGVAAAARQRWERNQRLYEEVYEEMKRERASEERKKPFRGEMGEDEKAGADLRAALAAYDAVEAGAPDKVANGLRFAVANGVTKCNRCGVYLYPGDDVIVDEYGTEVCAHHGGSE